MGAKLWYKGSERIVAKDHLLRIAYLTSRYPAASHTFIQREVAALRRHGAKVVTASVRRPNDGDLIGPEETDEAAETFYVLEAAKSPLRLLKSHAKFFAASPITWTKALALALRTARPGAKGRLWGLFYFLEAGVLADWLVSEQATHLHAHFADAPANVAMLAGALANLPYSFTLHGPAELFEPQSWRLDEKIARAAFTACISHFARSQAMLFSDPVHWHRLKIIHCGVMPNRYAGEPPKAPTGKARFVFVGRLTAIKGLRVLFDAFEAAQERLPGITLTLIGDGDGRDMAEARAAALGGVTFLGFQSQEEVAKELQAADILVLPSFAEGVPVVLMEAMAAARPVIATQVGGVSELVENGVSGRLVAPGDAAALADAMIDLARSPDIWADMGTAGRKQVTDAFDADSEAERLLRLFQGDMDDGPR